MELHSHGVMIRHGCGDEDAILYVFCDKSNAPRVYYRKTLDIADFNV